MGSGLAGSQQPAIDIQAICRAPGHAFRRSDDFGLVSVREIEGFHRAVKTLSNDSDLRRSHEALAHQSAIPRLAEPRHGDVASARSEVATAPRLREFSRHRVVVTYDRFQA